MRDKVRDSEREPPTCGGERVPWLGSEWVCVRACLRACVLARQVKLFRFPTVGVPSAAFMRDGFMTGSAGMPGPLSLSLSLSHTHTHELPGRGPATRPAWYEAFPRAHRGHASKAANVAFSVKSLFVNRFSF